MNKKWFFLLTLTSAIVSGYCQEGANTERGIEMGPRIQKSSQKYFIGLELKTNNEECAVAMTAHKEKFFKENTLSKIPNKINGDVLALYTDYEGDYTRSD